MSESVPNSILRAIVAPYGAKLFRKQKKIVPLAPNPYVNSPRKDWLTTPFRSGDLIHSNPDALTDHEFMNFFGHWSTLSNWSKCRVCLRVLWGAAERAEHLKKSTCQHFLVGALIKLRGEHKCFVCGKGGALLIKYACLFCLNNEVCVNIWRHHDTEAEAQLRFRKALEGIGWKKGA